MGDGVVEIQRISGEPLDEIELVAGLTPEDVMLDLQKRWGVPAKYQQLVFDGDVLQRSVPLLEQGVGPDSSLVQIVLPPKPLEMSLDALDHSHGMHMGHLRFLLQARADPNCPLRSGSLPVAAAARHGHEDCVALLLAARASAAAGPSSPLHLAVEGGHAACVKRLLALRADPEQPGGTSCWHSATPLWLAARGGHGECLRGLLKARADAGRIAPDNGDSALLRAAAFKHEDCLCALLEARASPQQADRDGDFPLLLAVPSTPCLRVLLRAGAAVQQVHTTTGGFALLQAICAQDVPCIGLLLEARADVHQANPVDGSFPLELAAKRGHVPCVHALLEAAADPNQANTRTGKTPLAQAEGKGYADCACLLLRKGARPQHVSGGSDSESDGAEIPRAVGSGAVPRS